MTKGKRKCKSTYCRQAKSPYRYSQHYREWREATLKGDRNAALKAAEAHAAQFHYRQGKDTARYHPADCV